jgi:hypothetical protein
MRKMMVVLLCALAAFPGNLVKREKVPVEGVTITKTQKIIRVIGSRPDTLISYDTSRYNDTMNLLCTYVDTMLLVRVDTIKAVGEEKIPKKRLVQDALDSTRMVKEQPKVIHKPSLR